MDIREQLLDINNIAQALCNWFASQDIPTSKAVMAMSYLIGTMAAEGDRDMASVQHKLETSIRLMQAQAAFVIVREGK